MHILYETISNPRARGRVCRSGEECGVVCRVVVVYTDRVTRSPVALLALLLPPPVVVVVLIPIYAHRDRLRADRFVRNGNSAL